VPFHLAGSPERELKDDSILAGSPAMPVAAAALAHIVRLVDDLEHGAFVVKLDEVGFLFGR
jgi:hypothetical protein